MDGLGYKVMTVCKLHAMQITEHICSYSGTNIDYINT